MNFLALSATASITFALLAFAPNVLAQNIVQNPGFETGDFTSWTDTVNTGFTFVTINNPHTGTYSVQAGPSGSLGFVSQNLTTVAGTAYTVDFFLANNGNGNADSPDEFTASFNGVQLVDLTNSEAFGYTEYTYPGLVATGSSTALEFGFRNEPGYFFLDDVSVTPEPSTAATMLIGAMWLLGRLRGGRSSRG